MYQLVILQKVLCMPAEFFNHCLNSVWERGMLYGYATFYCCQHGRS